MSTITVDTIKAHLKASIAHGEDCIKDILDNDEGFNSSVVDATVSLFKTRNRILSSVLDDIERGVLMTDIDKEIENMHVAQKIHDDIRDSREY